MALSLSPECHHIKGDAFNMVIQVELALPLSYLRESS